MGSNCRGPGQNISCYREQNDGRTNPEDSVSQIMASSLKDAAQSDKRRSRLAPSLAYWFKNSSSPLLTPEPISSRHLAFNFSILRSKISLPKLSWKSTSGEQLPRRYSAHA
jgi:hypothetical protein